MALLGGWLGAVSGSEWIAFVGVLLGAGGVSALVTGAVAWHRINREQESVTRTVAAEEAESAVLALSTALKDVRQTAERCERRWEAHAKSCPLLGGKHE